MKKYKGLIILISLFVPSVVIYAGLLLICSLSEYNILLSILVQIIGLIVVIPLFIAIHEAGHMVFGIKTGYKLLSYKLGPLEWYRKDEKIKFRVNPLNGIVLGQCLMSPPKPNKKVKPKFYLYNAGGLIFSYTFDIILCVLFFVINNVYIKLLLIPMISISVFLTINNSLYQKGGINDVCNHVIVKNNPKYINSILYQLEMITNITNGKRYGAKTYYEPYFEDELNHITLPVAQLRFLQAVDKSDFVEAKRISTIIKRNYNRIPLVLQKVSVIFEILYTDLVIDSDMRAFKVHFRWIKEKEKAVCLKPDYEIYHYYNIYNKIYKGEFDIKEDVMNLLGNEAIVAGEKLSIEKKFNFLIDKINFYASNGNSFDVEE